MLHWNIVSKKLDTHTVIRPIASDQIIQEIALALRTKDLEKYSNSILSVGGFYLVSILWVSWNVNKGKWSAI